jgi:hypothetical protein
MPRLTIRLTDDEHRALAALAEGRGIALAAYVRERLGLDPGDRRGAPKGNKNAVKKPKTS